MKTYNGIITELKSLESVFGFDPTLVKQGSDEWRIMKLGVISASEIDNVVAGKDTAKRATYMNELVGQVCTGRMPEEVSAKPLAWGKENEASARSAYEFETSSEIKEVPFIYGDMFMRYGCSPDGILATKGLELKCPYATKTHIEFICNQKIKSEYIKQCQLAMMITGAEAWEFASYDPRMSKSLLHTVTIGRDEKMISLFQEAIAGFVYDMDKMLAMIGIRFGDQWKGYLTRFKQAA